MPDLEMTVATELEALSAAHGNVKIPGPVAERAGTAFGLPGAARDGDHAWRLEQATRAACGEFTEWAPLVPIRNHDLEQGATVEMNDAIVGLGVVREVTPPCSPELSAHQTCSVKTMPGGQPQTRQRKPKGDVGRK